MAPAAPGVDGHGQPGRGAAVYHIYSTSTLLSPTLEAIPGHPVGNVSPTFDAAAKDLRTVASSPIIRADEPKHRVDLDQPGRSGSGSVESALRELHHQLSAAHSTFDSYHNEWKADKAKIKYAEKETLENLWQDMLQAKTKGRGRGSEIPRGG